MGSTYSPSKAQHSSMKRSSYTKRSPSPAEAFKLWESKIEPSDPEKREASLLQEEIRSNLKKAMWLDPNGPDFLFGSYKQHTAISQIKDVDTMFSLDPDQYGFLAENKPDLTIKFISNQLKEIYGEKAQIITYNNCVTVKKENSAINIDIVPGFRNVDSGGGWLIPDTIGNRFIKTNPRVHQILLNQQNKKMNGKLVPLIKKMKALNESQNWKLESSFISTRLIVELRSPPRDSRHALREGLKILANSDLSKCQDPGVEYNHINNNLSERQIKITQKKIQESYQIANKAKKLEEMGDKEKSLKLWEKIAGNGFYTG